MLHCYRCSAAVSTSDAMEPAVMPATIANDSTLAQRSLTSGGSKLGACIHERLARCPFVTPSARFRVKDAASDLQRPE